MADAPFSLDHVLGLADGMVALDHHDRRVCEVARDILRAHAPDIAALDPYAKWDRGVQDALASAINERCQAGRFRDAVHNRIGYVIDMCAYQGLWRHVGWPQRALVHAEPSRVTVADRALVDEAWRRSEALKAALPDLLHSTDAVLVSGALLLAAADCSAVLAVELLEQIPSAAQTMRRHGKHFYVDLRLGPPDVPARLPRRWFPDPVSACLMGRLREIAHTSRGRPKAEVALEAICRRLDSPPVDLERLVHTSRARWALLLPGWLIDFATTPSLGPSLPRAVLDRLMTGAPLPRRSQAGGTEDDAEEVVLARTARSVAPWWTLGGRTSTDGVAQEVAVLALARAVRVASQHGKHSHQDLKARLATWRACHGHLGGWVALMGDWVHLTLFVRKKHANQRGRGPRAPGIDRYLKGFHTRWIAVFHDFPPEAALEHPEVLADRLDVLRQKFEGMKSAETALRGLRQFLAVVGARGGPAIRLDSEWRAVASPGNVDANLLTPVEFRRLVDHLAPEGDQAPYLSLRLRVMATLAYRLGLRWEELQTLPLGAIELPAPEKGRHGAVLVMAHAYFHGKSPSALRRLGFGGLLTPSERHELAVFHREARALRSDPSRIQFLFADPATPGLPPLPRDTHDLIQKAMRKVSGDPTLVFHHLRHSAANMLLLRLCVANSAEQRLQMDVPGFGPEVLDELRHETLPCAHVLARRPADDPARLYIIAKLLGHLDPGSAMQSYFHLVDLALAHEVKRHLRVSARVEAKADGVQTNTVYKRQQRAHGHRSPA